MIGKLNETPLYKIMLKISICIFVCLIIFVFIIFRITLKIKHKSLYPLVPKKYNFGKRRDTFLMAMDIMSQNKSTILLETGVARHGLEYSKSDGASTIIFGQYAKNNGAKLYSVDINHNNIEVCQKSLYDMNIASHVELTTSDSIEYLKTFPHKVDFLYLDSYDYNRYNSQIINESQIHHLNEIKAIENKLHQSSIILIDDCNLPGGGKGKKAINYLQSKGWQILISKYQVLLKK